MALPVRKGYSGTGVSTTLTSSPTLSDTTFTVAAVTNWPNTYPFYIVVDPGTAKEEKMKVTGVSTLTLTVVRGQDDTTAVAHSSGAVCYPVFTADEADEANLVASAMTTKGDLITTDGTDINRLAIGTNAHVLQADSTATNGMKWATVGASSLATDAVETAKIKDANVTPAKLSFAVAGVISPYIGASAPTGWLLCDGSTVTNGQTLHPDLWAVLPASFKSGADIILPNLKGKVIVGLDSSDTAFDTIGETGGDKNSTAAHTHSLSAHTHQMQNHTHGLSSHTHSVSGVTIYDSGTSGNWGLIATNQTGSINAFIQATVTSPTGGPSNNTSNGPSSNVTTGPNSDVTGASSVGATNGNLQPYIVFNYIIKT
jgi:microcystin-dependent protein